MHDQPDILTEQATQHRTDLGHHAIEVYDSRLQRLSSAECQSWRVKPAALSMAAWISVAAL